jgi:hypothetical protein
MAEPITYYDLEFRFTHGEPLYLTVQDGRDAIQDIAYCTHCGSAAKVKITVKQEDDSEATVTVHTDKLNGATSVKRIVQPDPPWVERDVNGTMVQDR